MQKRSSWLASAAVGACLLLAACGGGAASGPEFAPPDYSYLSKLRLNVGTVTIADHAGTSSTGGGSTPADPADLGPTAPTPPDQALQQMAHDRLIAAGNSGSALFTIDQASITGTGGGALDGRLAVHLDILTANGGHAGYAEAHVSRQFIPGTGTSGSGTRAQLYDLNRQMMQDMNVELEYQVQRSLREWLVDASGAPVSGSVEQQTLPPPGSPSGINSPSTNTTGNELPVGTTPVGAVPLGSAAGPVPLAPPQSAPSQSAPLQSAPSGVPAPPVPAPPVSAPPVSAPPLPEPQLRSPPAGFLQPPPGTGPPVNGTSGAPSGAPAANGY